jgi:hypothetical protein
LPRLVIAIHTEVDRLLVIVDTGGAYFVCDPMTANLMQLSHRESIGTNDLIIRGYRYRGDLYRTRIQFVASKGESFDLDVTAFVPRLPPGDEWHFPSFLGLQGCLEFIRFAVDPATNTFFFGPLA